MIGRKFVPRGALDRSWNVKLRVCPRCNNEKSQLEDDISAITMQPDAYGRFATEDPRLRDEARRKANGSISRRTGKHVGQSEERLTISGKPMSGLNANFSLSCPPQLDRDRAGLLARYHMRAFFFLITYEKPARTGRVWDGCFAPVAVVQRPDWGNRRVLGFQSLVQGWEHRLHAIGASDYFAVVIRRSPGDRPLWAWALEWNRHTRLIGFFGDQFEAERLIGELPRLQRTVIPIGPDGSMWFCNETPLAESDDRLFDPPELSTEISN